MIRISKAKIENARVCSAHADLSQGGITWLTRSQRILTVTEGEVIDYRVGAFGAGELVTYGITSGNLPGVTTLDPRTGRIFGLNPSAQLTRQD